MKKFFCIFSAFISIIFVFSCSAFATNSSWQTTYFNKLIEIREKPGLIHTILTDKDNNGFSTEDICYALNDYNQDGTPELIVYGTNIAGEAGDNYQVYAYSSGKLKKFDIISHKGPWGENLSFSDRSYWPYYTNFFFLPEGYVDKETNELIWVMKTAPNTNEFWAIAGTPYESETVFEVNFDFQNMTADIIPVVFAEETESNEYSLQLQSWKDNHKHSINRDEYGRIIPENNEELWKLLSELSESSDSQMPEIKFKNKILILFNKTIKSAAFWIGGFVLLLIILLFIAILSVKVTLKPIKKLSTE